MQVQEFSEGNRLQTIYEGEEPDGMRPLSMRTIIMVCIIRGGESTIGNEEGKYEK